MLKGFFNVPILLSVLDLPMCLCPRRVSMFFWTCRLLEDSILYCPGPLFPGSLQQAFSGILLFLPVAAKVSLVSGGWSAESVCYSPRGRKLALFGAQDALASSLRVGFFLFPPSRGKQWVFICVLRAPGLLPFLYWLIAFVTQGLKVQVEPSAYLTGVLLPSHSSSPQREVLSNLLPCP